MSVVRELEYALSRVESEFPAPKIKLEQYPTTVELAAHMIGFMVGEYGDVEGDAVVDLGSGTGMLTCGVAVAGAASVTSLELDTDAIAVSLANIDALTAAGDIDPDATSVAVVHGDVLAMLEALRTGQAYTPPDDTPPDDTPPDDTLPDDTPPDYTPPDDTPPDDTPPDGALAPGSADIVILNPPFGTKNNAGVDLLFVEAGMRLATRAVYSLHKTSTRKYITKWGAQMGASVKVLAQLRYDLPASYKFHKKANVEIEVDFVRFDVSDAPRPLPIPQPRQAPGHRARGNNRGRGKRGGRRGRRR